MQKRTEGAWIINHTKKLHTIITSEFEDVEFAGKCGMFLSNLAASDEQFDINKETVDAIAKVSHLKKTEVDTIKNKLVDFNYIDSSKDGSVSVLGITSSTILNHTSDIFNSLNPTGYQKAALDLSENVSDLPKGEKILREFVSDNYQLSSSDTKELFLQSEEIGFLDYEKLDENEKIYFNGNLFRRENAAKTSAVLNSLKPEEVRKISEIDEILSRKGCIPHEKVLQILGEPLLAKLQSIGMYDFNEVSNSKEVKIIVTKPSAFSKFGNPFEEDALDLAKAFVSSLFYGMTYSTQGRGQITMLKRLMQRLVNGGEVGSATAIGEDYNLLVFKRVIKLRPDPRNPKRFFMKLLKKDVGELAMHVLEFGDIADATTTSLQLYSGSVTNYSGPEQQRVIGRKKDSAHNNKSVTDLLRTFRS